MLHTLGRRRAFPETNETLEHLNKRYLVCIGSTTDTSPLIRDLENNHITVHHVFTSESLQAYKPQRIFYE
jgi:FMN phosphatase YigB (HAD superfamily)